MYEASDISTERALREERRPRAMSVVRPDLAFCIA